MMWVIKDDEKWNGEYNFVKLYILEQNVFPFLMNEENVEDIDQVTLLHDNAPCFKAMRTQEVLENSGFDFFDNTVWPGSSPDLNLCENINAILKDKFDTLLHRNPKRLRKAVVPIRTAITKILKDMENDKGLSKSTELFSKPSTSCQSISWRTHRLLKILIINKFLV